MGDSSSQWKREAARVFESATPDYANTRESEAWYRTQLNFAMAALEGRKGRVLDLGCAAGVEIAALRSAGFDVVGADFVEPMLHAARRRFAGHPPPLARADAEFLPFAAGSFDHLVCLGVLEYLAAYDAALSEARRVLRPGGVVVFALPSRISLFHLSSVAMESTVGPVWRAVKRLAGRAAAGSVPPHHRNLCVPGRFLAQLSKAGFEPLDHAHTAFFFAPFQRFWPSGNEALAKLLEPFGRSRWIGWMGSQFMVAARKAPRTY